MICLSLAYVYVPYLFCITLISAWRAKQWVDKRLPFFLRILNSIRQGLRISHGFLHIGYGGSFPRVKTITTLWEWPLTGVLRNRKCLTFFTPLICTWFMKYCLLNFLFYYICATIYVFCFFLVWTFQYSYLWNKFSQFCVCSLHDTFLNLHLLFHTALILCLSMSICLPACVSCTGRFLIRAHNIRTAFYY